MQQSASKHYFRYSHFPRVHKLSIQEKIYLLYLHCILKFWPLVKERIDTLGKYSEFLADFLIFHVFKDITIASLLIHYAF